MHLQLRPGRRRGADAEPPGREPRGRHGDAGGRSGGTRHRWGSAASSGATSTGSCSRRSSATATRRYETANALALDLERHLEHKPVVARPPTLGYTAGKFVRRHRLGVSVAAAAVAALVVLRRRHRARAEPRRARGRQGAGDQRLPRGHAQVGRPVAGRRAADHGGRSAQGRRRAGQRGQHPGPARRRLDQAHDRHRASSASAASPRPTRCCARRWRSGSRGPARRARRPPELLRSGRALSSPGQVRLRGDRVRARAGDRRRRCGAGRHAGGRQPARPGGRGQRHGRVRGGATRSRTRRWGSSAGSHGERHLSVAAAMARRLEHAARHAGSCRRPTRPARAAIAMLRELGLERNPQMVADPQRPGAEPRLPGRQRGGAARCCTRWWRSTRRSSAPRIPTWRPTWRTSGWCTTSAGFADSNIGRARPGAGDAAGRARGRQPGHRPQTLQPRVDGVRRGDYAAAEPLYEEALDRMRRAYGPEHTDVVWATASRWGGTSTISAARRGGAKPAAGRSG